MIDIKTPNEISIMAKGGKILAGVLGEVLGHIKPGVSELELDLLAERLIREKGGEPAFKNVKGYSHTICVSTNNVVVHGVPTNYKFKAGDIVGIDCGVYYKGYHTDAAQTVLVQPFDFALHQTVRGFAQGRSSKFNPSTSPCTRRCGASLRAGVQSSEDEIDKFLKTGKKGLLEAIKQARPGNRVGHISKTIQDIVEGEGYSVVRSLVGHGVGRSLHEEPEVPGFLATNIEKTPALREGMTIAIEVIYNMGKADVEYSNNDGWTIKTKDNSVSGLFERTIAVTKEDPLVLTK